MIFAGQTWVKLPNSQGKLNKLSCFPHYEHFTHVWALACHIWTPWSEFFLAHWYNISIIRKKNHRTDAGYLLCNFQLRSRDIGSFHHSEHFRDGRVDFQHFRKCKNSKPLLATAYVHWWWDNTAAVSADHLTRRNDNDLLVIYVGKSYSARWILILKRNKVV